MPYDHGNRFPNHGSAIALKGAVLAVMLILFTLTAVQASPTDPRVFLGLSAPAGGKVVTETDSRLELVYKAEPKAIEEYYKKALGDQENVKFKERPDRISIEDHGARRWHSITIHKETSGTTKVVLLGDNWTWIMGTLVLRFFGVFVVLLTLYAAMAITGAIVSRAVKLKEAKS